MGVLPEYYVRLYEAVCTSEAEDRYDLNSEDPMSVSKWDKLRRENAAAQLQLLAYVVGHKDELIRVIIQGCTDAV